MATQSLDQEIGQYLSLLGSEEKQSLLGVIKSFVKLKESRRITITQYNEELAEAEERIVNGAFMTLEDALKQSESW